MSVLSDPLFTRGAVLTGATHAAPQRIETWERNGLENDQKPIWRIAQWHSRGTLDELTVAGHEMKLTDSYKSVVLNRETGAFSLTVLGGREYADAPRTSQKQPWVHLLLEQPKFDAAVRVAATEAIWCEIEFELTMFQSLLAEPLPIHATQFQLFLYLKNTSGGAGQREFLWFGLSLFDNREQFTKTYAAQDFAMENGNFIYTVGSERFLTESVALGKRLRVRYDILPELRHALATAKQRGFMKASSMDELVLDGMNIGWEVPGVFDSGIIVHRLQIEAIPTNNSL